MDVLKFSEDLVNSEIKLALSQISSSNIEVVSTRK